MAVNEAADGQRSQVRACLLLLEREREALTCSTALLIVEWRMPGLPRPGSMLGGMIGVKVLSSSLSSFDYCIIA
jgi:hypothetical protein